RRVVGPRHAAARGGTEVLALVRERAVFAVPDLHDDVERFIEARARLLRRGAEAPHILHRRRAAHAHLDAALADDISVAMRSAMRTGWLYGVGSRTTAWPI